MGAERRKKRRVSVRIDTFYKGTARAGIGQVSNLSASGCRMTSNVPLAPGDQVVLTFYFGKEGSITVLGRIVSIGSRGAGLKFENLTASLEYQLNEVLETFTCA
jgi:hypothetical protein